MSSDEVLAMRVIEAALREELKPVEQAKAYRRLMELEGWSTTRLGRELSVSQSSVVATLKLLELPAEVQQAVEQGDLSRTAAYEISKLDDPAEQIAVAGQVVAGTLRRTAVRTTVRQRNAARGEKTAPPRRAEIVIDMNTIVVTGPSAASGEALVAFFLECARRFEVRQADKG